MEQREIKLRSWDKEEKVMYYSEKEPFFEIGRRGFIGVNLKSGEWRGGANHVLMLSTGLKDSEGKEIYEGDIVQTQGRIGRGYKPAWIEEVHYSDITAKWYPQNICVTERCRVLGNIFENPKLLKK